MAFHPQHMMAGVKAAIASHKTPSHLKPHLQARLGASMNMQKPNTMKVKPLPSINPYQKAPDRPLAPSAHKAHPTPKKSGAGPAQSGKNPPRNASKKPVVPNAAKAPMAGKKSTTANVNSAKPLLPPEFYGTRA